MSVDLVLQFFAVFLYLGMLTLVAVTSYKKQQTDSDFIIGGRSMNFYLTAFAAHASDMSSWLFMGYPAAIFAVGIEKSWAGIGLWVFFYLNWQFIAPRVRTATEQYNSLTFSSFFENRLGDRSGVIRIFTALMLFVFYTIYISAALMGMGYVLDVLFEIPYQWGILLGILIVVPYVFIGGYLTLAWIDLFQGLFLMAAILFVPLYILPSVGGFDGIMNALHSKELTTSLLPDLSAATLFSIIGLAIGWGLGYFGQPHIITKFMGIKNVSEIGKSKMVGMTWMFFALGAATLVGLVGIPYFRFGLNVPSEVFIQMVKQTFPPFFIGLILCSVFAATINAMSSMVLVMTSSLSEDIYKKLIRKYASSKELLLVSRFGVIFVSLVAYIIAALGNSTIYDLVLYAWSGLGASFGPLLLACLFMKNVNKYGAWCGILAGGIIAAIWPLIDRSLPFELPALIPAFVISYFLIWIVSFLKKRGVIESKV